MAPQCGFRVVSNLFVRNPLCAGQKQCGNAGADVNAVVGQLIDLEEWPARQGTGWAVLSLHVGGGPHPMGGPLSASFRVAQFYCSRISANSTVPRGVAGFTTYGTQPMLANSTTVVCPVDTLHTKVIPSGKAESRVKITGNSFGRQCGTRNHWSLCGYSVQQLDFLW